MISGGAGKPWVATGAAHPPTVTLGNLSPDQLRHRNRQHLIHNCVLACVPLLQYSDNIVKLKPGVLQKNQDVKKQISSLIRYFSTIIRHPR